MAAQPSVSDYLLLCEAMYKANPNNYLPPGYSPLLNSQGNQVAAIYLDGVVAQAFKNTNGQVVIVFQGT